VNNVRPATTLHDSLTYDTSKIGDKRLSAFGTPGLRQSGEMFSPKVEGDHLLNKEIHNVSEFGKLK